MGTTTEEDDIEETERAIKEKMLIALEKQEKKDKRVHSRFDDWLIAILILNVLFCGLCFWYRYHDSLSLSLWCQPIPKDQLKQKLDVDLGYDSRIPCIFRVIPAVFWTICATVPCILPICHEMWCRHMDGCCVYSNVCQGCDLKWLTRIFNICFLCRCCNKEYLNDPANGMTSIDDAIKNQLSYKEKIILQQLFNVNAAENTLMLTLVSELRLEADLYAKKMTLAGRQASLHLDISQLNQGEAAYAAALLAEITAEKATQAEADQIAAMSKQIQQQQAQLVADRAQLVESNNQWDKLSSDLTATNNKLQDQCNEIQKKLDQWWNPLNWF